MYYPTREEFQRDFDFKTGVIIGQGAYGKVLKMKCQHQQSPLELKYYAIKYLEVVNEAVFHKLQNEFVINKLIDEHTNIIKVLKYYAWQEVMPQKFCLVLVLELASHNLHSEILQRKRNKTFFSAHQLMELFRKCLSTLSTLKQSKQIYHRDIKPENILISTPESLEPKLTDFGVSKTLHELKITESLKNTLVGTPVYLSPLLWDAFVIRKDNPTQGDKIKHDLEKTDIFALGLTFLQCVLLLTNEIVGINQAGGQEKKQMLLDKIENDKIRNLISCMLEYDEKKRSCYLDLLSTYCQANPKAIFQNIDNIQKFKPSKLAPLRSCVRHQNSKADQFCYKADNAKYPMVLFSYFCDQCVRELKLSDYCIPLMEQQLLVNPNTQDQLSQYANQIIRQQFIKAAKLQLDYAINSKQDALIIEQNIRAISQAMFVTHKQQDKCTQATRDKLDKVLFKIFNNLASPDIEQAVMAMQQQSDQIQDICSEMILEQTNREQGIPQDQVKQRKRIFETNTQLLQQNSIIGRKQV